MLRTIWETDGLFRMFNWMVLTGIIGYISIGFNKIMGGPPYVKRHTQIQIVGNVIFAGIIIYTIIKTIIEFINLL